MRLDIFTFRADGKLGERLFSPPLLASPGVSCRFLTSTTSNRGRRSRRASSPGLAKNKPTDVSATVISFHSYNGVSFCKVPLFINLSVLGMVPIKTADEMLTGPSVKWQRVDSSGFSKLSCRVSARNSSSRFCTISRVCLRVRFLFRACANTSCVACADISDVSESKGHGPAGRHSESLNGAASCEIEMRSRPRYVGTH